MTKRLLHHTIRVTRLLIGLAIVVGIVAALAIQYRIYLANEWQDHVSLPQALSHGIGDRVMVFAPHSDDETLGCGGMLADSVANGASVQVVLVTNGDGFRIAVGREYKTVRVTPEKCIEFANKRQQETIRALGVLGISSERIVFLGYPDRGIDKLWTKHWSPDVLFVSKATGVDRSPYANSLTPLAQYCGESLLADIEKTIRDYAPTDVYVPHPCDNHPDHYATYCFIVAAIEQLRASGLKSDIRMHTYLVHRGDWPTPKGDHPGETLTPPFGLAKAGAKWYSFKLSPEIAALKRRAIREYRTQIALEKTFLMSFARSNELFGSVPLREVVSVEPDLISIDGDPDDWVGIPPAIVDAVSDYVVAELNKGGDVRSVYLASDGRYLLVRVDFVRRFSKRIKYTINFRGLRVGDTDDHYSVSIGPGTKVSPAGTLWATKDNNLEISIPLNDLDCDSDLFVQVHTKMVRLTVDNTGWQAVDNSSVGGR